MRPSGRPRSDVGRALLRTAFPKLGEWADKQEADKSAREQAADQERRDEIAVAAAWRPCSCR